MSSDPEGRDGPWGRAEGLAEVFLEAMAWAEVSWQETAADLRSSSLGLAVMLMLATLASNIPPAESQATASVTHSEIHNSRQKETEGERERKEGAKMPSSVWFALLFCLQCVQTEPDSPLWGSPLC